MNSLSDFQKNFQTSQSKIQYVFCDIDDTITTDGKLPAHSYEALWRLHNNGIHVIPVTGRPAGWCEMIARFWPVSGIIGENGAFYFRHINGKMERRYMISDEEIKKNRKKLDKIAEEIIKKVKGSAVSSDQFCRIFDLAIDFCEDVRPLPKAKVNQIVEIFKEHKAEAKVSSIHVNGWFGNYDKLSMCKEFMKREFKVNVSKDNNLCAFVGDSPNDEPMFEFFKNSFAVQNIKEFVETLSHKPAYICPSQGADGFVEFANTILLTNE